MAAHHAVRRAPGVEERKRQDLKMRLTRTAEFVSSLSFNITPSQGPFSCHSSCVPSLVDRLPRSNEVGAGDV